MNIQISRFVKIGYLILVYSFFYLPIIVLIFLSFNNVKYSLSWHGFTWHWYQLLFHDPIIWTAALHSLIIGVLAASIASLIGLVAAVNLYRYRFWGHHLLHSLLFVLIIVPDIVMGTSLLILFSGIGIRLGFWTLLFAHITFCIPFVVVTVYSRISEIDKNIFEAAKDLGASDLVVLARIIAPLLVPAILAGWLLSFTLSVDDIIISYFLIGPTFQILPLQIFAMVRQGSAAELNALSTLIFVLTIILVSTAQFIRRRQAYIAH